MSTSPQFPSVHRIRLRGPWEFAWIKSPAGLPAEGRNGSIRLPATWAEAFGDALGTVRLSRRFNRPTGLDQGERVWLELTVADEVSASLDGDWLGHASPGTVRFDVTGRLAGYGRIDLDLRREDAADGPIAEVTLVIESED